MNKLIDGAAYVRAHVVLTWDVCLVEELQSLEVTSSWPNKNDIPSPNPCKIWLLGDNTRIRNPFFYYVQVFPTSWLRIMTIWSTLDKSCTLLRSPKIQEIGFLNEIPLNISPESKKFHGSFVKSWERPNWPFWNFVAKCSNSF